MKRFLLLTLTILILNACTVPESENEPIPVTQVIATIDPHPTATSITKQTTSPTTIPTDTPEPTLTQMPIPPSPTITPILLPTETSMPKYYDLPSWIANPNTNVLAVETTDDWHKGNPKLTFFNAETGERFDIPYESSIRPFWKQKEDGLYLGVNYFLNENNPEEINISSGKITQLAIDNQEYTGIYNISSPDNQYLGQITKDEEGKFKTILINQATQEVFELDHPNENGKFISSAWSPDSQMLAIWSADPLEENSSKDFVTIYTINGKIIGNYTHVNSVKWSPESPSRILFSEYNNYESTLPCLLNPISNTRVCFDKVSKWRREQGISMTDFQWSPDGQKISFIIWNRGEPYGGGLCIFDLNNEDVTCPVMPGNLQLDDFFYLFVRRYFWSADGQYIAFYINPNPPPSDDGGMQSIAIVDSVGENLTILGPSNGWWNPWRP